MTATSKLDMPEVRKDAGLLIARNTTAMPSLGYIFTSLKQGMEYQETIGLPKPTRPAGNAVPTRKSLQKAYYEDIFAKYRRK